MHSAVSNGCQRAFGIQKVLESRLTQCSHWQHHPIILISCTELAIVDRFHSTGYSGTVQRIEQHMLASRKYSSKKRVSGGKNVVSNSWRMFQFDC